MERRLGPRAGDVIFTQAMTDHYFNHDRSDSFGSVSASGLGSLTVSIQRLAALYNERFSHLDVADRIGRVLWDFPGETVVTTSGGIQSGFLLAQLKTLDKSTNEVIRSAVRQLPIVFLDTGDLFPETIQYVTALKRTLGLNIIRYRHGLSEEEFGENMAALEGSGLTPQSAFDELTKVRPMKTILSLHQARIWIAGNRRDQSPSRADLPYAMVQNSYLKVYPMADVQADDVKTSLASLGIPRHPLSGTYRSIGNVSDTQPIDGAFEKSGRHSGLKQECGLHEGWVSRGKTLKKIDGYLAPIEQMPVRVIDL